MREKKYQPPIRDHFRDDDDGLLGLMLGLGGGFGRHSGFGGFGGPFGRERRGFGFYEEEEMMMQPMFLRKKYHKKDSYFNKKEAYQSK